MAKTIQIRNVPDEVHRVLQVRAARAGMSLSAYLLREVTKVAERPALEAGGRLTLQEALERARTRARSSWTRIRPIRSAS